MRRCQSRIRNARVRLLPMNGGQQKDEISHLNVPANAQILSAGYKLQILFPLRWQVGIIYLYLNSCLLLLGYLSHCLS